MAQVNLGRIGFVNKGDYLADTDYKINDIVTVGHKIVYSCTTAHTSGAEIDESNWTKWTEVIDGIGIDSLLQTAGDGSPGTKDEYTITFTDDSTVTFNVYNGDDMTNASVIDDDTAADITTYSSNKIDEIIQTVNESTTSAVSTVDTSAKARSVAMAIALS